MGLTRFYWPARIATPENFSAAPTTATVQVMGDAPIWTVDPEFLSFTVDSACLKPHHCRWPCPNPGDVDGVVTSRARHLAPFILRVGGTSADNLQWAGPGATLLPPLPTVADALGKSWSADCDGSKHG